MDQKNAVLIATLGESPDVIQAVVWKLAQQEKIHLSKVIILHTTATEITIKKTNFTGFLENVTNYKESNDGCQYERSATTPQLDGTLLPDYYNFISIGVEDVYTDTEDRVENAIYYYVLRELTFGNNVYVSIAGGRKTESAIGYGAGLFFGAEKVVHVLPTKENKIEDISVRISPNVENFKKELEKYDLIEMKKVESYELFKVAFRKTFLVDMRELEPQDNTRTFKIKGEEVSYSPLNLLNQTSEAVTKVIKSGLRSFINLGEALDEFGKIMAGDDEFCLYKEFVNFIENGIVLPEIEFGVNWKLRWLWGINVYPEFVNHDIDHGGEVLKKACQIVKEFGIQLCPEEKLVLALGAIFHDIGMTGYGDKFHWTEVRKVHGILSALKIKDEEGKIEENKIFRVSELFTRDIWKAVRTICAFHDGKKFNECKHIFAITDENEKELIKKAECSINRLFEIEDIAKPNGSKIRLNLLTSLLRLADACDMGKKMLMDRTVKELQVNWNKIGKDKAVLLAKVLLNCPNIKESGIMYSTLAQGLNELRALDVQIKGKEGMRKTEELVKLIKKDDSCALQLKEILDRVYYFFKQSPDHYDFHEKIEKTIIKKEDGSNKIIIQVSEDVKGQEKKTVLTEAKKRLTGEEGELGETGILEKIMGNNFKISVEDNQIK